MPTPLPRTHGTFVLALATPLVVAAPRALAQSASLFPARSYTAPAPGNGSLFADLDRDGRQDAIGVGPFGQLRWSRALPNTEFAPLAPLYVSPVLQSVDARDGDADGDLDLYLTAQTSPVIRWLHNDGAANFSPAGGFDLPGLFVGQVRVADLNGDPWLDVVAAMFDLSGMTMWSALGQSNGGFAPPTQLAIGALSLASQVRLVQVDGQAGIDVLVATSGEPPYALLNDGSATFSAPQSLGPALAFTHLLALDADLDGRVDLVYSPASAYTPMIAFGAYPAPFGAGQSLPASVLALPRQVVDRNADAWPDLALATVPPDQPGVQFLLGGPGGAYSALPVEALPEGLFAFSDLDGDGPRELLLAADSTTDGLIVVHGSVGASYAPYHALSSNALIEPRCVESADLNADGHADLVFATNETGAPLEVQLGQGGGAFAQLPAASLLLLSDFALADATGDGRADALGVTSFPSGFVECRAGAGDGTFGAAVATAVPGPAIKFLASADFDGDGRADVCVGGSAAATTILYGQGDGTFAAPVVLPGFVSGARPGKPADLNGDGFLDPIAHVSAQQQPISVHWWLSSGAAYVSVQPLAAGINDASVVPGDFDGDGAVDLALPVSNYVVEQRYGDGAGTFPQARMIALAHPAAPAVAADVDLDGRDEVVCGALGVGVQSVVQIVRGDTAAALADVETYRARDFGEVAALDADDDGRLELVTDVGDLLSNLLPLPAGLVAYGNGTSGCAGAHTLSANGAPKIGNAGFALTCQGAPPQAHGIGLVGVAPNAGSDVLGIGLVLHVALVAPLVPFSFPSSVSGSASRVIPIPNDPQLVGAQLFAQVAWLWSAGASCNPSLLNLSSSRGLALTIQP